VGSHQQSAVSRQQSAISESFTATDAKSAKEKHLNKIFFLLLCALRALCGKEVWLTAVG
jgi:hypothetical protein